MVSLLFSSAEESDPELLSESDPDPESEEREFLLFLELLEESESSLLDESYSGASQRAEQHLGGQDRKELLDGRGTNLIGSTLGCLPLLLLLLLLLEVLFPEHRRSLHR